MAAVKKAVKKALKKAKPSKATKATKVEKKSKENKRVTGRQIYEIIAETLENNSEGEFDLPSFMVRYLDKSHPSYGLGLHREHYIPAGGENVPYYPPNSEKAQTVYHNQASIVMYAFTEGIKVRHKRFDLPLCKRCK